MGERCQDALCLRGAGVAGDVLVAALADGAGSAPRGGAGAALAARAAASACCTAIASAGFGAAALADGVDRARQRVVAAAEARGLPVREFATTLILLASDGRRTCVAHVGDGAVVLHDGCGWRAVSWPAQGLHAGSTYFLTDPDPQVRVADVMAPVAGLAAFTDGLERLVLDFASQTPHAPFFDRMLAPVSKLARQGRDPALSAALRDYLGGEAVCARTDDDKTLLLAAPHAGCMP